MSSIIETVENNIFKCANETEKNQVYQIVKGYVLGGNEDCLFKLGDANIQPNVIHILADSA